MGAVAVGRFIIVIVGWTMNDRTVRESFLLDTANLDQGWTIIDSIPLTTPRRGHTATFINNTIFVCGGGRDDSYGVVDTMETISFSSLTSTYLFP